jgi:hypothetical protein
MDPARMFNSRANTLTCCVEDVQKWFYDPSSHNSPVVKFDLIAAKSAVTIALCPGGRMSLATHEGIIVIREVV